MTDPAPMTLRIDLPERVLLETGATRIVAEGTAGSFALLPRHRDIAAALVPGILAHVDADGRERFVGLDHGVLVKAGARVTVAAMGAVTGESLADLRDRVRARFVERDAAERAAQTALARLESGVVRRILDMEG